MKERPIIFIAPMVRAILEGRKTMTRRIMKPQPVNVPDGVYCDPYNHDYNAFTFWTRDNKMMLGCGGDRKNSAHWKSPYGVPGDQLWVRENFYECIDNNDRLHYSADGTPKNTESRHYRQKPSIHMPRWASRITLIVKSLRVERVQDITEDDAKREGVLPTVDANGFIDYGRRKGNFSNLWNSIHGEGAWDLDPWVWVIEFEKQK